MKCKSSWTEASCAAAGPAASRKASNRRKSPRFMDASPTRWRGTERATAGGTAVLPGGKTGRTGDARTDHAEVKTGGSPETLLSMETARADVKRISYALKACRKDEKTRWDRQGGAVYCGGQATARRHPRGG